VLAKLFDYETASTIAKEAYASGETVADVAVRKGLMSEKEVRIKLDPVAMTQPVH
jgi:aspartate ammonia-lyase